MRGIVSLRIGSGRQLCGLLSKRVAAAAVLLLALTACAGDRGTALPVYDLGERRDRERPFFLYLHTVDPHKPYLPDEEERLRWAAEANIAQLKALYDAEVAQNDASFGDTLDALEAAGLYDDALIVFLSDPARSSTSTTPGPMPPTSTPRCSTCR